MPATRRASGAAMSTARWRCSRQRRPAGSPPSSTSPRPPAVYGPGDRETLELFKMARGGQVFMPPKGGRASYIHVDDLARLLLVLTGDDAPAKVIFEPDDGRAHGWSHEEMGEALGRAVGMPARTLHVPRAV